MEKKDVSKFSENFIKDYDESLDKGYILEVGIEYPKGLYNLHNDLPFLSKRMKIKNVIGWNLYDIEKYVAKIRTLKQHYIMD